MFSPETCVPFEDFSLDGPKHKKDEADGSELREDTEHYAEGACEFGCAQEQSKAFAQFDVFAASVRVFEVFVAAGQENKANHEAQEEEGDVGGVCEEWKEHRAPRGGG